MGVQEKIDEIFRLCANGQGQVDFFGISKFLWAVLDNTTSLCDISGVFTVVNPSESDFLNLSLFHQFISAISRIKYHLIPDHTEKFLNDLQQAKSSLPKTPFSSGNFQRSMDKNVIRVLLKYDIPLRRIFSNFAGRNITVGGGLTWDEVKRLNIGMEVEGFVAFAGAHSLIPSCLSSQQCASLAREVASHCPTQATLASNNTILLYPQFQLLLCFAAIERHNSLQKDNSSSLSSPNKPHKQSTSIPNNNSSIHMNSTPNNNKSIGKDVRRDLNNDSNSASLADMLTGLFKHMGLEMTWGRSRGRAGGQGTRSRQNSQIMTSGLTTSQSNHPNQTITNQNVPTYLVKDLVGSGGTSDRAGSSNQELGYSDYISGEVELPTFSQPEDTYTNGSKLERQAMIARMDRIFDDIVDRLKRISYYTSKDPNLAPILSSPNPGEYMRTDSTVRLASKPVVIADAVPLPSECPESIEQILESALAHHNIGNFQEALKFLEAARIEQEDHFRRQAELKRSAAAQSGPIIPVQQGVNSVISSQQKSMLTALQSQQQGNKSVTEKDVNRLFPVQNADHSTSNSLPSNRTSVDDVNITSNKTNSNTNAINNSNITPYFDPKPPFECELYIILCKGNVYQSSGDDEHALVQYMIGWDRAIAQRSADWEVVCLNSIGLLCYYNLRYELAMKCFAEVVAFREANYTSESGDTATALNNMACCLFCLSHRGDARMRFEKSWNVLSKVLGARHPRTVVVWRNLDKAKRSVASLRYSNIEEGIHLRPDSDKLLVGSDFRIQALDTSSRPNSALKTGRKKSKSKGGKKK